MSGALLDVVVAKKRIEAEAIASFELVHPDGKDLPAFSAGSHIDLHIRAGLIRQYSLCNDPAERHRYLLGVLREADGTGGSAAMHDLVQEGDLVSISEPRNTFHLVEDAPFSLLLAGGIGVTPILCMAQRLARLGAAFEMHYCTRSRARGAFFDVLSQASFADRVQFHYDNGPKAQLLDMPALVGQRLDGAQLYVCGPPGFMDAVIKCSEQSWPKQTVHREYFSNDPQAGHADDAGFKVKIASSGDIIDVAPDQTIVEALAAHGISIPVSCEQGICGTCLTGVIEGEPEHRDSILTDEEHDANDEMTLCCSRSKSDLLVLDL